MLLLLPRRRKVPFMHDIFMASFQGTWQAMGLFMHSDSFKNCRTTQGTAAGPLTRAANAEL